MRIASLAHLWVDRTYGDEGLRARYDAERARYDERYGEALRGRILPLRAAQLPNPLNPRTFEEAEAYLAGLVEFATSEEAFVELVGVHSDDAEAPRHRRRSWAGSRAAPRPRPRPCARRCSAGLVDAPPGESRLPSGGVLVGPVRMPATVALVWLSEWRPTPGWDEMAEHVHRELRKEFIDECLDRRDVITYLDTP